MKNKYVSDALAKQFFEEENSGINRLINPMINLKVETDKNEDIIAEVEYKNYGKCLFCCKDFEIVNLNNLHSGFSNEVYKQFIAKNLAKKFGEEFGKSRGDEYVEELITREYLRHENEMKNLMALQKIVYKREN